MNYKTILRISDLLEAVEDWKRQMITDEELADKILAAYKALAAEQEPKKEKKKVEENEKK